MAHVHENVIIGGTGIVSASTSGLHERDKFDFWHEVVGRAIVDLACEPSDSLAFNASVAGVAMEALSVVRIVASPHRASRNPKNDDNSLVLNFVVSGRMIAVQDGRETLLLPGDGAICVAERPYLLRFDEAFEVVTVRLPRACVERSSAVDRVTAIGFSKAGQMGPLIYGFADVLSRQVASMNIATTAKVSKNFADLLATALDEFDPEAPVRPRYRIVVLARVKDYVERHLGDADLGPAQVARMLKLTARYINKLFEAEGTTLSRYIWRRRIERIADDLANPAQCSATITDIAFRHGFNDLSHFSRSFRQRFDSSPSDYRVASVSSRSRGALG